MKPLILSFVSILFLTQFATAQSYTVSTLVTGFNAPVGNACDGAGNVYIANFAGNTVQEYTKGGTLKTIAGDGNAATTGDGGPATAAEVNGPVGLAVDDTGNLYIVEYYGCVIRKVNKSGIINTIAGNTTQGYSGDGFAATAAELNLPTAAAFDALGDMYIADAENNVIRMVNNSGTIYTVAGNGSGGYSGDGAAATDAELNYPAAVAVDGYGNLYIGDFSNDVVRKVDNSSIITTFAGNGNYGFSGDGGAATAAKLTFCDALLADAFGNVFLCDDKNDRIRKVDTKGIINTIAGTGTTGYSGDGGPATAAEFADPDQISMDDSGYIYVGDEDNNVVRKLSPTCRQTISINPSNPTSCSGQPVTIIASGANGYQWSPASALNKITGDTVVANPFLPTTIEVCSTDSPFCFSTLKFVVNVGAAPVINVDPLSPSVCAGQGTLLVASGCENYTWSPVTGLSATTGDSVIANPTVDVTYTVSCTDSNGCTGSFIETITVTPAPNTPTITAHGDTLFSSAATNNQWFKNDTLIPGATGQYYIVSGAISDSEYSVTVTNPANGCSSTAVFATEGIDKLTLRSAGLSMFPNPASNQLTIISKQLPIDNIEIANLLGQTVLKSPPGDLFANGTNPFYGGGVKCVIDVSTLTPGMYFITITEGNETATGKIVIDR